MPDVMVVEGHRDVLTEVIGPRIELGEGVVHKAIGHPGHADEEDKPEEIEKTPDVEQEWELLMHELTKGRFA